MNPDTSSLSIQPIQAQEQPSAPVTKPTDTPFNGLKEAFKVAGPVFGGMAVLGVGFGVLVNSYHLPLWVVPMLTGIVFAGSVEFLIASMLTVGAPLGSIALTTLLVNARHLLYGISYPLERVRGPLSKFFAIYTLCDEAYVLNSGPDRHRLGMWRILWIHAILYGGWILSAVTGYLVGSSFLSSLKGLDFVMTALFLVMAVDTFRANPDKLLAAFALGSAALALLLVPGSMLLVSMCLYTVLLLARYVVARSRGTLPATHVIDQEAQIND
ncbi:MAG: AzlC family ABC transporter permease [Rothia sp. (in: high G+C Gram-positive bacteria)]|uniref:AzlC family ABC transporter permease n=1 Tax=Rothia sp. (in: high G+C Gram-positive bacteria) TaxID=1885016 RepID=UPI0026DFE552|nr:AzlC family ABC transporter permease [Rothia sp. (in: high G+C Gram-positive bacteria)]MDO5750067.1 AzlC family ABC transporter permease [Rothia sp. (in: high G+C Gram-positive bacteria)]